VKKMQERESGTYLAKNRVRKREEDKGYLDPYSKPPTHGNSK